MTVESVAFRTLDRLASQAGLFHQPMRSADLIARARRRAGLIEFGECSFEVALGELVRSYNEEAHLSAFGKFAARWDVMRFLSNLLMLQAKEAADPTILARAISRPIFVTGVPRSGTTFLHSLLALDPANLVPRFWQTIYPYPERRHQGVEPDTRPAEVDRQLAGFARLAPEIRKIHPVDARSPQECTEITAHVFRSLRFDAPHDVPSYRRWLDREGHLEAYRFHARFLKHLQLQTPGTRWVLKCPDHIFALDAIRTVYPDARFVILHRDPIHVLASVARLTEILRQPFTRRIDRAQIGRQVSDHWARGVEILVADKSERPKPDDEDLHLQFRALADDPLACVETLYDHLGLPLEPTVRARMEGYVAARPQGGYGRNRYRLEDYGLDPARERARFGEYVHTFSVAPEAA